MYAYVSFIVLDYKYQLPYKQYKMVIKRDIRWPPLLGIYPEKTLIQKDTCTPVFTAAQSAPLSAQEWGCSIQVAKLALRL